MPEEALEHIVELNELNFRRELEESCRVATKNIREMYELIESYQLIYLKALDLKQDSNLIYYMTTDGSIGYWVVGEKKAGFLKTGEG